MKKRRDPSPEFDLFLPIMGDLPLKDQRETMERPFFSWLCCKLGLRE